MMRDLKSMSRGGHVGVGGVQAWSAGDLFPWTIYTIEHYVPLTVRRGGVECSTGVEGKSLQERFLWAEIRMRHPDGADVLLATAMRGDDMGEAHAKASKAAERALRTFACLDTMERVLGYGRPSMSRKQRVETISELALEAIAEVKLAADREKALAKPIANTVMTTPMDKLGAMLYNHTEGFDFGTSRQSSEPAMVNPPYVEPFTMPAATAAEARMKHAAAWGCT